MNIDYRCQCCGVKKSNTEINSMICKCGGDFRAEGTLFNERAIFEPFYDRVLRTWVTSYNQQEKLAVAHRSPSHPEGLRLVNWDRKYINELKNIKRHKEDYKASVYPGYKPGNGRVCEN